MSKANFIVFISAFTLFLFSVLKLGLSNIDKKLGRKPKVEAAIPSHDLSVNHIDWYKSVYGNNGLGLSIALKENSPDSMDIDIRGKLLASGLSADEFDTHATAMATILAGRGTTSVTSLGVASQALLKTSSFSNVLPDPDSFLEDVFVQNHSYGFDIDNQYDDLSKAYDQAIYDNPNTLHVFSSGNLGTSSPDHGTYDGIVGFANLSGGIKQAKNTLVVGATNPLGLVSEQSSKGPTFDGRLKPELVAYGSQGTSEAAALVSGSAILLTEHLMDKGFSSPSSDLLKSIIIASAQDVDQKGPDYSSGYGALDLASASTLVEEQQFFQGTIIAGEQLEFIVNIPDSVEELRVALVWNDVAADQGVAKALINDLDLSAEQNGLLHRPYVTDARPAFIGNEAIEKRDSLNNVELLIIERPSEGAILVNVEGFSVDAGSQSFSIAYGYKYRDRFQWYSPNANTKWQLNEEVILRYYSGFEMEPTFSVSRDGGAFEQLENPQSFVFSNPGDYVFRAELAGNQYFSDVARIRADIELEKLFECGDELLFTWRRMPNVEYQVMGVDPLSFELEEILTTQDTFVFLNRSNALLNEGFLKVMPIEEGVELTASMLYEFENDGIGCLYKNWSASVNGTNVGLSLALTTDWNIEQVSFLKVFEGDTIGIGAVQDGPLTYIGNSTELRSGYYQYLSRITFEDPINNRNSVLTDVIETAVFSDENNVLFPNPLTQGEDLYFLGQDDISRIRLFDMSGNFSTTIFVNSNEESFTLKGIASGLYLYQLIDLSDKLVDSGRIILQ